jgi:hypothetical protein
VDKIFFVVSLAPFLLSPLISSFRCDHAVPEKIVRLSLSKPQENYIISFPKRHTMAKRVRKEASTFLLFPWSLLSIVLILFLNIVFSGFFGKNWSWLVL